MFTIPLSPLVRFPGAIIVFTVLRAKFNKAKLNEGDILVVEPKAFGGTVKVHSYREGLNSSWYQNLDVKVDTVDGFQGKECDIVIFSVTRTVGTPVFVADKQRLNVALSRARDRVIIVGNSKYAHQSEMLKKVWEKSDSIFYETIESIKTALQ